MSAAERECGSVRLLIGGRVQGVGYRNWMVDEARRREVSGWVRNLADGRVEAVLHGRPERVAAMVEACGEGPALARVSCIERLDVGPGQAVPAARFEQR